MKSKEQIISDSIKLEIPPKDYNLIETHCFLALKQLLVMFHNKQITTENASKTKKLILAEYEKKYKEFQENLNKTEDTKTKLKELLNDKNVITEERLYEIINLAVEILATVFKGEFV